MKILKAFRLLVGIALLIIMAVFTFELAYTLLRVPSFLGLLDQYRCQMVFDSQDECVSASGAAMMCLHNLFSVPILEDAEKKGTLTWQQTIDFLQRQKQ